MSNKKLIYFLTVLFTCGLIATGTAHAAVTGVEGTISNPDGTPAAGVTVAAPGFSSIPVTPTTGTTGYYFIPYISFANVQLNVGHIITIQLTDAENNVIAEKTHSVTQADIDAGVATFDITLSALAVEFENAQIPADGVSTSQITVTGADPGDTITISATQGSVSEVTENADGTYTATYTAPSLALRAPLADQITVQSADLDQERTGTITLTVVPTIVDVAVAPNTFTADAPGTGDVTITVTRGTDRISDEEVTVSLSRGDGKADMGMIGAVTNNGDGTYTATYASGGIVGSITLTATATQANARGTASITVNAGPPTEISLRASPDTVSSYGSAIITATVRDAAGNGVGGLILAPTISSGGALTPFLADETQFGRYTATYTAPVVEVAGTETITVTVDGISAEKSLTLNPVPPIEVGTIIVTGTVYKEGGEVPIGGIDVTVTIGEHPPQMETTGPDGTFTATVFMPGGVAARTGDIVTIVAEDDTGERGSEEFVLTNELLEDDDNLNDAVVSKDVITDIIATTPNLLVEGTVFLEDGLTAATSLLREGGLTLTVTNTTRSRSATASADSAGAYDVTFFEPGSIVAETGDDIVIEVQNDAGEVIGTTPHTLTTAQVDAGRANLDATTQLLADSVTLAVFGTVFLEDGLTAATSSLRDDDLTVVVTNADRSNVQGGGVVRADGGYTATLFNPPEIVAQTGDELTVNVEVQNSAGETVGPPTPHTLTTAEVAAQRVELNLTTDLIAMSQTLVVSGTVYLKNGDGDPVPATSNFVDGRLTVVVTNTDISVEGTGIVRDDGNYTVTLFNPPPDVAATRHQLIAEVQNDAGEVVGTANHTLTTAEVAAKQVDGVNIGTELLARINSLLVVGSVLNLNDEPAGAGLAVTLTLVMNGSERAQDAVTDAAGNYETLFFETGTVVATGDRLVVNVSGANGYHGHAEISPLRSSAIVYQNQPLRVDPIYMLPPVKALGGLSINPQYVPEDLKRISRDAIHTNPTLLNMIPSGILYLDLLKGQLPNLPAGFDPSNDAITKENFGNAITPRPIWHVLGQGEPTDPGRWFNGDLLSLYVLTGPTADDVRFRLSGAQSMTVAADRIAIGGAVPYTFQLEEERAVLFLPSWDGVSEASVFASVDLMIDEHDAIPMAQNMDTGVWEVTYDLNPGAKVSYYYQVKLAQEYEVEGKTVVDWAMPDPRNLQVEDRGIVETLLAPELGPDLVEIVTRMNLQLRSVFNVPLTHTLQSLWVRTLDLSDAPDGMYQLDTTITHAETVKTDNSDYQPFVETIDSQMFTVDRSAPTADLALTRVTTEGSGLYQNPDGSYVVAAKSDDAALTVTATPTGDPMDPGAYLYQRISLNAEGQPGAQVWNPAPLTTALPLTYMDPHQVTLPIGGEDSLMGYFGLRAAGIDSILNISSMTVPTRLELVPPDPDNAAVMTVHADFINAHGAFSKEQSVADGVTIFSDRSAVELTLEITAATKHPLTKFEIDFQIDGEGDWKPIKHHTADELVELGKLNKGDELSITWDRTEDFADLLDMRGTAMVRVTVENALEVVRNDSIATFEVVPPALLLGGLSLDTSYAETHADAWNSMLELDLTGLLANMLQTDPLSLVSPSLLPIGLAFIGILGEIDIELPAGFEPHNEQIHHENFGNAITPRPVWYPLASEMREPGRWINGNQLHLYTLAGPTAESVTFSITGAGTATAAAEKVDADGSFMYTFQLEEELLAIFAGSMPAFGAVTLMIDHHAPISMELGDGGVWSAEAAVTPGSTVSYYYIVELAEPYQDEFMGKPIQVFPLPDPRNLQVREGSTYALMKFLNEGFDSLPTLDSGVRSRFAVPAVDTDSQSLWVGKLDLSADGEHQVDVTVQYSGGSTDALAGQVLNVDRTAPTADTTVDADAPGENIGMYEREPDVYVATAINPGAASLNVTATPIDDSDLEVYMYQFARLDDAGNPGTWNPMLTLDLLGDLTQLFTNPAGVLPLTSRPPHNVQMLVRSEAGGMLDYGAYGLRVVGIDNILNADSLKGPDLVLNLVPPDPDIAEVTYVTSDFDGNGVIEGLEMQSAAGDVVVYSESLVTLTVEVMDRTDHPLASVVLEYQIPGSGWLPIGGFGPEQLAGVALGDSLQVPLPVPDIPVLPDRGAEVMLRTVTTNALNIVNEHVVTAQYERRLAPNVSAIYADVTDRNPDSGAAQGSITVSAFTQAMTNLPTAAVQLEIRRTADADWMPLGVVQIADSTVTSYVNLAIIDGLVNSIVNGAPTAPISVLYRQWPLTIDSALLADTILDDTPAASDASLDDNPYVLRAIAVDTEGTGYESVDAKGFSLDNYSPTAITTVANEVEAVAPRADGSYYVSGLLHESVPDPMLTLTARTGAHPNAFTGGMALAVNDASGTAVEIPATAFTAAGYHNYTGVFNLASIPNGMYTFRAVAHAADGSPEERIVAMEITVEVGNFTPPENFADPTVDILSVINTQGDARSPSEIDAEYTAGFPAIEDKVTATLMVPNVSAGDLDVLIGGDHMSAAAMDSLMVMQMEGSIDNVIMVDTSGLEEGMHGLVGVVIKPNGSIQFALPAIRVDRTGPEIAIVSPTERHQITGLPTIHVTFSDATGFDVTDTDPRHAVLTLTRLGDEVEIDITETLIRLTAAADGEILTRSGDIVYTHDDSLIGGAYRIGVTVMDVLGNESVAQSVEFTVEGVQPTVSIVSPSAGHIVDPRQPLIVSVALTGNGDITISEFQINGNDLEGTVEDGWLTYTMRPPLVDADDSIVQRGSDNTISVKIVDSEGRTAEGAATFAVSLDDTAPMISGPSPKGEITRKLGRITAMVTDNESDITRIQFAIDDNPLTDLSFSSGRVVNVGGGTEVQGQTNFNFFDAPFGTHTVTIVAESTGGSSTLTWEFTIVHPDQKPPEVVTYSPLGIIRTDRPVLAATVSDESGFARDGITLILAGVPGNQGSGRRSSPTSTTVTFTPSISVTPGPYTARLTVVDRYNNRTEAEWQFTVELDETPPSITTTAPHGVIHVDKPIITISASDDRSGVDSIAITAKDSGGLPVNGVTDVRSDKTAATFTPTQALKDGVYTVDVKVADQAGNEASARWQFTVDLDLIPPSILITRPSQEHTENRRPVISAAYTDNMSGVDVDSIKLTLDGTTVEPDDVSETQVVFTPGYDLPFGEHTVSIELSDSAPKANSTVHEWTFYVERIGIADARNYPNPFDHETTITFRISRQARITVRVYDFTGRLVATPVANSIREAGVVEIDWHGETSAGDHLARGVYFCHILMESELEPQSAILKMAIVAD